MGLRFTITNDEPVGSTTKRLQVVTVTVGGGESNEQQLLLGPQHGAVLTLQPGQFVMVDEKEGETL